MYKDKYNIFSSLLSMKKIDHINQILHEYFEHNKTAEKIHAKDMMSYFILAGIFKKDIQNGLPIREFLNRLEKKDQIQLIPFAVSEKKNKYAHWYFKKVKYRGPIETTSKKKVVMKPKPSILKNIKDFKKISDEVLGIKGKINFVIETKPLIQVDLFYAKHNLVIELLSPKKNETSSSTTLKSQKKQDFLTQKGIRWIQIPYDSCENKDHQMDIIKNFLHSIILL